MKRKKIMAYILLAVAVLFILFQSFVYMSTNKTKEQPYTVLEKDGDIEIRLYPSATLATVQSKANSYDEMASPGFRALAGYIFGGNESETQIAMTSPVQMDINDSLSSMSFVMPEGYDMNNLPKPNNSQVILSKTEEQVMAAIRFSGFADDTLTFFVADFVLLLFFLLRLLIFGMGWLLLWLV